MKSSSTSTSGINANDENPPKGCSIVVCRNDYVTLTLDNNRFHDAVHKHLQGLEGNVYHHSVAKRVLRDIKELRKRILYPLTGRDWSKEKIQDCILVHLKDPMTPADAQ
jgi:hypothetical protein